MGGTLLWSRRKDAWLPWPQSAYRQPAPTPKVPRHRHTLQRPLDPPDMTPRWDRASPPGSPRFMSFTPRLFSTYTYASPRSARSTATPRATLGSARAAATTLGSARAGAPSAEPPSGPAHELHPLGTARSNSGIHTARSSLHTARIHSARRTSASPDTSPTSGHLREPLMGDGGDGVSSSSNEVPLGYTYALSSPRSRLRPQYETLRSLHATCACHRSSRVLAQVCDLPVSPSFHALLTPSLTCHRPPSPSFHALLTPCLHPRVLAQVLAGTRLLLVDLWRASDGMQRACVVVLGHDAANCSTHHPHHPVGWVTLRRANGEQLVRLVREHEEWSDEAARSVGPMHGGVVHLGSPGGSPRVHALSAGEASARGVNELKSEHTSARARRGSESTARRAHALEVDAAKRAALFAGARDLAVPPSFRALLTPSHAFSHLGAIFRRVSSSGRGAQKRGEAREG